MLHTKILSATGSVAYEKWTTLSAGAVMEAAEARMALVKTNGQWVEASLAMLGRGPMKAIRSGTRLRVDEALADLMMATWLID